MPNEMLETVAEKKVTIGTVLLVILGGGSYMFIDKNPVYDILDDRYVTIAAQNVEIEFSIEDELAQIQRLIDAGTATTDDLVRKAVLEERLKRLGVKK